jgi:ribosomal protein L9
MTLDDFAKRFLSEDKMRAMLGAETYDRLQAEMDDEAKYKAVRDQALDELEAHLEATFSLRFLFALKLLRNDAR